MNLSPLLGSILPKARSFSFWLRVTGAAFLTLLAFYALFLFIDPAQVFGIISEVSMTAVFLGFIFYIGSTLFRAARFQVIHPKVSTHLFFSIASIHTLLTNMLPARTGELTFPVLLKRVDGTSFVSSLSILFIARIFDLVAVFVLFFAALAMTYQRIDLRLHLPMLAVSLVFVIGLAIIFAILIFGRRALAVARCMLFFDGLKSSRTTAWIFEKLEILLGGFQVIRRPDTLWRIMFFSILIWACNYAAAFVIVHSMGLGLSLWVITLGFTFSTLFSSLPIHGIGFFGTLEGFWTLIFLSFGATKEVSLATGFGFHLFNIIYLVVLGILGMIYLFFMPRPSKLVPEKGAPKKMTETM